MERGEQQLNLGMKRGDLVQMVFCQSTFPEATEMMYHPGYLSHQEKSALRSGELTDDWGRELAFVVEVMVGESDIRNMFEVAEPSVMGYRILVFRNTIDKMKYLQMRDGESKAACMELREKIRSGEWKKG